MFKNVAITMIIVYEVTDFITVQSTTQIIELYAKSNTVHP